MPQVSPRTILVVDDEPPVLNAVADLCASLGFRVFRAEDGLAALPHLGAGVDLLISDIRMPNLDGPGLLRRVRERFPALPVIVMTGYADSPGLAAMVALNIVGVLRKPFRAHELRAMIRRALPGESPTTPDEAPRAGVLNRFGERGGQR
jgi:CheY-like chemotaxis protein